MPSNKILLTGASGVVGSSVLRQLAAADSVVLLLRAKDPPDLAKRLAEVSQFAHAQSPLRAVAGDITQPDFGWTPATRGEVLAGLTHVIHCAANVQLDMGAEEARLHAVAPTEQLLTWQRESKKAGTEFKLDYVSTVGVGGRRPKPLEEAPVLAPRQFHNTYEESKAHAEELLYAAMDAGQPVTIHRPSMVVGDSATGEIIHFQIFYLIASFLSGRYSWGILPDTGDLSLDTVPSDFVGRAIAWSAKAPQSMGQIYHLSSGPELSISFIDLEQMVTDRLAAAGLSSWRIGHIPLGLFDVAARATSWALPNSETKRRLAQLPLFLNYAGSRPAFPHPKTMAALAAAGIALPPAKEYLPRVLDYFIAQKRHRFV